MVRIFVEFQRVEAAIKGLHYFQNLNFALMAEKKQNQPKNNYL